MSDKAKSRPERLQFDTEGQLVGKLVDSGEGRSYLLLEPNFMLIKMHETGRIRIWDNKHRRLVDLLK
jgi:hypothetical protein